MIKYFCDRCKYEIGKDEPIATIIIENDRGETEKYHICRVCKLFLSDFLNGDSVVKVLKQDKKRGGND